jgi:hypothetical protein
MSDDYADLLDAYRDQEKCIIDLDSELSKEKTRFDYLVEINSKLKSERDQIQFEREQDLKRAEVSKDQYQKALAELRAEIIRCDNFDQARVDNARKARYQGPEAAASFCYAIAVTKSVKEFKKDKAND